MIRRHLPLAGAAALLLAAGLLALLARDVRAWQEVLPAADRGFQVTPGREGRWTPDGLVLGGASRSLLALEDDLRLRRGAQVFRRARLRSSPRNLNDLSLGSAAQVAFGEIQSGGDPPAIRSIAANQLGVLALVEALSDPSQAGVMSRRAVQKFAEAVRLDPSNEVAQANLELVLTLLDTDDARLGFEDEATRGGGAGTGAGSSEGGSGL